ncbi:MAG: biopolymer transporter ExbD [Nibricoccus sp.]
MKKTKTALSFLFSAASLYSCLWAAEDTPKQADQIVTASSSFQLQIDLDATGKATIQGRAVDESSIAEILRALVNKDPEASVLICASEKGKFEPISKIMEICRKNGVKKFSMTTRP